jgi:signal transduction histidine kinase
MRGTPQLRHQLRTLHFRGAASSRPGLRGALTAMESLANALQYVNIAAFGVLAFVCFRAWRAHRGEAAFWAFATFGLLAIVAVTGPIFDAVGDPHLWVTKAIIALIVFFPYFLYRFAVSFGRPSRWIELTAAGATAALVVWSFALPDIPEQGEPRSASFTVFVIALLVQWTALSLFVAARLWRAGRGHPTVVRYRMRLLAVGAVALSVVLILAGLAASDPSPGFELLQGLLTLGSMFLFFFGFAPPKALRKVWREPEEELLRRSVDKLLVAVEPEEVTRIVLPQMAHIVGARGVALLDADNRVLGTHGIEQEEASEGTGGERFELGQGAVVAWTSPYAPLFAQEEFELLRALGGFALLAYERKSQVVRERKALEEADQLKTNFIALASHELRTPASVIHGIASTLHLRGELLADEQVRTLRQTLYEQTDRMRRLVDQLLDLSRLEANGIRIEPQPLNVLSRVQELLQLVTVEGAKDVTVNVPADLEALVDPNAFDRIVSNLIVNATRYGETPIEISAEQRDRHFRLSVEDHGRGVPAEFVPQLFERFTRSGPTGRERAGGAGLGLAIAKSYAQAHGGDLLYEDARPHGARFQLVLPRELNNH